MNKKCKAFRILLGLITFLTIMFEVTSYSVASEVQSGPYIVLESYSIDEDAVIPGKDFKLKLTVKNVDTYRAANGVVVSIAASTGISPAYSEVPQVYVGDLNAGESKEIEFKCIAQENCPAPTALFNVSIVSNSISNGVVIAVPVEEKRDVISIISASVPTEAYQSDAITAEVRFKTVGEENYSDVTMEVFVDGKLEDTYKIGNMYAGAIKTQNATIYLYETGVYELSYVIRCTDAKGEINSIEAYSGDVSITENPHSGSDINIENSDVIAHSNRDIGIMVGCLIGSFILLIGIVVVLRKNR